MPEREASRIILTGFSWPAGVALCVAAALMVAFTLRAVRRGGGRGWVALVLTMRLVALAGVAFAVLRPQIERRRAEPLKNKAVLLLDGSMSMDLPAGVEGRTRQQVVQGQMSPDSGPIKQLLRHFELHCMEFGSEAREAPVTMLEREASRGWSRTDLRAALRAVIEKHGGEALAGVLLVSDGADTELPRHGGLTLLEEVLNELSAPVFAFCPADEEAIRDVGITEVACSRLAFVRSEWEAEVTFSVVGYRDGEATVLLRRGENVVDIKRCPIDRGPGEYNVKLGFTPVKTGQMMFDVQVELRPDEALSSNNHEGLVLSVLRDRIRVLQVAGRPSWDVRFLRRMLKQTPTVDLVSFFILRDIEDDPGDYTEHSYVNLIPFPTRELFTRELETFDVIVLQNFGWALGVVPSGPPGFRPYLEHICRQVQEGGAGLVMIGGERAFDLGHYSGTPIEDLLPVRLRQGRGVVDERPFRPRLTELGRKHPITRVESESAHNQALWGELPELAGCHLLPGAREDARVLLEHPELKAGGVAAPIVAVAEAGRGRTMAVATDETWKWGYLAAGQGRGNRVYLHFWRNALRWLVRELQGERITIGTRRRNVEPGQQVQGTVHMLDSDYMPQQGGRVRLTVTPADERTQPVLRQELTTDEGGTAPFEFSLSERGTYRIGVEAMDGTGAGSPEALSSGAFVRVATEGPELAELRPNVDLLRAITQRSGGEFYNIAREDPPETLPLQAERAERLVSREVIPLWNHWWMYVLVVGVLCVEWWMRRRRGVS